MVKPKILVVYYSQSGQLRDILDSALRDVKEASDITYAAIEPVAPLAFPWKTSVFFDTMPECVTQEPAPVQSLPAAVVNVDYDLIVLGWQPWFLHPSQPVTAFLQSEDARLLGGKPVITIVGSRNMWLNAGEKIKEHFLRIGANHIANIVFTDSNPNLVSLLTIIRWSFSGRRAATKWLPQAGVQEKDITAASRFGRPILEAAKALAESRYTSAGATAHLAEAYDAGRAGDEFRAEMDVADTEASDIDIQSLPAVSGLHEKLLKLGAVKLNTGLVILEQRGVKNFRFWAKYIREKGGPGSVERKGRVKQFQRLLTTAVFVLSPISSFTAFIQRNLQKKKLLKDVEYFKGLSYEKGRI